VEPVPDPLVESGALPLGLVAPVPQAVPDVLPLPALEPVPEVLPELDDGDADIASEDVERAAPAAALIDSGVRPSMVRTCASDDIAPGPSPAAAPLRERSAGFDDSSCMLLRLGLSLRLCAKAAAEAASRPAHTAAALTFI
jgi:hypothetical protein